MIFFNEKQFFQNYTRAFLRYVIYICLLKRGYFNVKQNNKPLLNNKFRLALIPSYKNRNTFTRKIMNCFSLSLSNLQLRRLNTAIYQTNLYVFSINNNTRSLHYNMSWLQLRFIYNYTKSCEFEIKRFSHTHELKVWLRKINL